MKTATRLMLPLLVPLIFLCSFHVASAQAQSPMKSENDRTLQALVDEFRLLRKAIQQINLTAYRTQVLFERMRVQNERVARLARMLEDTRNEIADHQFNMDRVNDQLKAMENEVQGEPDGEAVRTSRSNSKSSNPASTSRTRDRSSSGSVS